jgi:uncharacterized membrane protein (GlpM family)
VPDVAVVLAKAATGGAFVVLFALLGQGLRPKEFAGLFGAAPSIALASLIVTVADLGGRAAAQAALGMVYGAVGFVAFTLAVRALLARLHAAAATSVAAAVWALVALGGYFLVLR